MEATEPKEREDLEEILNSMSNAEVQAVSEESGMPAHGRVIANSLMIRVSNQTEGALKPKMELEDPQFYYEAVVRVCKNEEIKDSLDGWGIPKSNIDKGELLAGFGIGSTRSCVASFEIEYKQPIGKRSRQGTAQTLNNTFSAAFGSLVTFVDENDTVHRAAIMSFALYVPKERGGNLAEAFGGQVVLIAYVFDATTVSMHFVVRLALQNPRSAATVSCVPHAVPQTLFRSSDVDVAGFPNAVVVDSARVRAVHLAYMTKWKELGDEDLESFNRAWWECSVLPGNIQSVWDGVPDFIVDALTKGVAAGWTAFVKNLNCIAEPDDDGNNVFGDINVAVNTEKIKSIVQCNETCVDAVEAPKWIEQFTHKALANDRFDELSWLSYTSLPSSTTVEGTGPSPTAAKQEEKQKFTDVEQLLELNDAEFLKKMLPSGVTAKSTTARMQLRRLFLNNKGEKLSKIDVDAPKVKIWARFLSILHDGSEQLPAWVEQLPPRSKDECKQLAQEMLQSNRWAADKVTSIKNKIDAIQQKPVPKPRSELVDVEKEANKSSSKLKKNLSDQKKKRPKSDVDNKAATSKKVAKTHEQEEQKSAVPSAKPMIAESFDKIAESFDKIQGNQLQRMEFLTESVNSMKKSVNQILESIQTNQSAPPTVGSEAQNKNQDEELKAKNTKLSTQIELFKAAMKIVSGALSSTDQGKAAMNAARCTLGVGGMGFDEAEMNTFLPAA